MERERDRETETETDRVIELWKRVREMEEESDGSRKIYIYI